MAKIWEILGWTKRERRLAEFGAKRLDAIMKGMVKKQREKEMEAASATPLSLDDLRAILANLGQDLSGYSDDEVQEMMSKHNALQDEAVSIMQSEDVISFTDDEGKPVVLSDEDILEHVRADVRQAEAENDGRDPVISRLVDAVGALHDMLRRRLVKEKAEEVEGVVKMEFNKSPIKSDVYYNPLKDAKVGGAIELARSIKCPLCNSSGLVEENADTFGEFGNRIIRSRACPRGCKPRSPIS